MLAGAVSSEGLTRDGWFTFKVAYSHGRHDGAACWWEISIIPHVGLFTDCLTVLISQWLTSPSVSDPRESRTVVHMFCDLTLEVGHMSSIPSYFVGHSDQPWHNDIRCVSDYTRTYSHFWLHKWLHEILGDHLRDCLSHEHLNITRLHIGIWISGCSRKIRSGNPAFPHDSD